MFNGLKDFMRRDKPENEDEKGKSKKGTVILFVLVGAVILNVIIQVASGNTQYKSDMLAYIHENIHISLIDIGIMAFMLAVLAIIKIKKNKK